MTPAPDDLSLDLLARYLRDDATAAERQQVERWVAADPTRATELEDLRGILAAARPGQSWDLDRIWGSIERRTRPVPRLMLPMASGRRWSIAMRVAAAIVILVSGAVATLVLGPGAERAQVTPPTVIATSRAQRLSVRLADSTLVILAPESRLEVAADYGRTERRVRLDGEAAFTVEHDVSRPFAVETPRAVARDLGTRFLVRAYAADSTTEVVVAEGLVAVSRERGGDSLVVAPGERARVEHDGQVGVTRGVALERYFGWTDGRLIFENTPLREAAEQIRRWYDVEVRLADPALGRQRVTAAFRGESADEVLRLVGALLGLDITRRGEVYTLRLKS